MGKTVHSPCSSNKSFLINIHFKILASLCSSNLNYITNLVHSQSVSVFERPILNHFSLNPHDYKYPTSDFSSETTGLCQNRTFFPTAVSSDKLSFSLMTGCLVILWKIQKKTRRFLSHPSCSTKQKKKESCPFI